MELPASITSVLPLALPTWHSPNPVCHLLLRMGRGPRQASSSFMSWVLQVASKLFSPVLKASEVPSMGTGVLSHGKCISRE